MSEYRLEELLKRLDRVKHRINSHQDEIDTLRLEGQNLQQLIKEEKEEIEEESL